MIDILQHGTKLRTILALAVAATAVSVAAAAPAANAICCLPSPSYSAYGFGSNNLGLVGDATTATVQATPVQVHSVTTNAKPPAAGNNHSVLLKNDGTVAGPGRQHVRRDRRRHQHLPDRPSHGQTSDQRAIGWGYQRLQRIRNRRDHC